MNAKTIKVLRGGSYIDIPWYCRSGIRYDCLPGVHSSINGFRVVKEINDGKVMKGGCYLNIPGNCRCAIRGVNNPVDHKDYIGFRVAKEIKNHE